MGRHGLRNLEWPEPVFKARRKVQSNQSVAEMQSEIYCLIVNYTSENSFNCTPANTLSGTLRYDALFLHRLRSGGSVKFDRPFASLAVESRIIALIPQAESVRPVRATRWPHSAKPNLLHAFPLPWSVLLGHEEERGTLLAVQLSLA
jgi:hypothetical protein